MGRCLPSEYPRVHPDRLRNRTIDGLDTETATGFHINYDTLSRQIYSLSIYNTVMAVIVKPQRAFIIFPRGSVTYLLEAMFSQFVVEMFS